MIKTKNLVIGLGEIGKPLLSLLSKYTLATGYDINKKLMNYTEFNKLKHVKVSFLHICIPFSKHFATDVLALFRKFNPDCIVIHSTVRPNTTKLLQKTLPIPLIYSATRGVHKRMLYDLKRYVKFYALEKNTPKANWASLNFEKTMKKCGIKTKRMSNPITLELAKIICDTSYYGWLIAYSQISNIIAKQNNVNYDEMWSFADEIHKYLGNRPKMFPGFIGGHCVIPNLKLIDSEILQLVIQINKKHSKFL